MKIDLAKYLTQRYLESLEKQDFEGPLVTISRESGCPSRMVAARLVEMLNKIKSSKVKDFPWRFINKEILSESARELNLDPSEIEYIFKFEKKNFFDDILSSQSQKYYKSDRRIRNTVAKVVRNIASEGNVVIIGRGGVAITKDMDKSLHVMLEAPLNWRIARTSEKYGLNEKQAKELAVGTDKKRKEFRDYFHGSGTDYTRFDVKYNCMTLSVNEIAESITNLMKVRGLI